MKKILSLLLVFLSVLGIFRGFSGEPTPTSSPETLALAKSVVEKLDGYFDPSVSSSIE